MKGFYLMMAATIAAAITTAVYFQFFHFVHWYQVAGSFVVITLLAYFFIRHTEKDDPKL